MAESQNNENTDEIETIIMSVLDKIISNIDYEIMEEELTRIDDFNEEPTVDDLAGLLLYAMQFAGDDDDDARDNRTICPAKRDRLTVLTRYKASWL